MATETSSLPDKARLRETAARVRHWLNVSAWPLWIERGIDSDGLFYEQLDFAGQPDLSARRRVRVQGRQLFCFAQALASGHEAGPRQAEARTGIRRGALLGPRRQAGLDPQADAGRPDPWTPFATPTTRPSCCSGLAAAYRVGFDQAWTLAERTMEFLDRDVADPKAGGYLEGLPPSLPRRSNPHMHMMEAMLVWHTATGEQGWLDRADTIASLFETRFFDHAASTLGEYFFQDLRLADGEAGDSVEPGHHFEWSWLLHPALRPGRPQLPSAGRCAVPVRPAPRHRSRRVRDRRMPEIRTAATPEPPDLAADGTDQGAPCQRRL